MFTHNIAAAQDFTPIFDITDSINTYEVPQSDFGNRDESRQKIETLQAEKAKLENDIKLLGNIGAVDPSIFGALGISSVTASNRAAQLTKAKLELARLENDLAEESAKNNNFWDIKSLTAVSSLGVSINPNRLGAEEGEKDPYFSPSLTANFTKKLKDSDGKAYSFSTLSLTSLLYAKDHFDDVGPDVELTALSTAYTKIFNDCWAATLSPGARLITSDFYSDRVAWNFPMAVILTHKTFDKDGCNVGGTRAPKGVSSLQYTRMLSDPAAQNRHIIRAGHSRNFTINGNTTLNISPLLEYTSYSNLADRAKLEDTDIFLGVSLIRKINKTTNLSITGQVGKRNSTSETRDSKFADLPISLKLIRSF